MWGILSSLCFLGAIVFNTIALRHGAAMRRNDPTLALAGALAAIALVYCHRLEQRGSNLFSAHMMQHLAAHRRRSAFARRSAEQWTARDLRTLCSRPAAAWMPVCRHISVLALACRLSMGGSNAWQAASWNMRPLLCAAFLFWSVAFAPKNGDALNYGARALFVMTAAVATDLPGVIMVFAPRAICTMPGENAARWGLTPLEDQQIAGLLMWVPANLVFFSIATWLFARWMSGDTHSAEHLLPPVW